MPRISCPVNALNLRAVLLNGQSFRWIESADGWFVGTAWSRLWLIRRISDAEIEWRVVARSPAAVKKDDGSVLHRYLQLDVDLSKLYAQWSAADAHTKQLLEEDPSLHGIRILAQHPVETIFSFICSANNNIPRITKLVQHLCLAYGSKMARDADAQVPAAVEERLTGDTALLHDFPTLDQLATKTDGMQSDLRAAAFGYRADYIAKAIDHLKKAGGEKAILELRSPTSSYETARTFLLDVHGVGNKVADCIALMGLSHHAVVPVDTHVLAVTTRHYPAAFAGCSSRSLTPATHTAIGRHYRSIFGDYAGWAQALLFNAQRTVNTQHKPPPTGRSRNTVKRKCVRWMNVVE